jgi:hypothetical protein
MLGSPKTRSYAPAFFSKTNAGYLDSLDEKTSQPISVPVLLSYISSIGTNKNLFFPLKAMTSNAEFEEPADNTVDSAVERVEFSVPQCSDKGHSEDSSLDRDQQIGEKSINSSGMVNLNSETEAVPGKENLQSTRQTGRNSDSLAEMPVKQKSRTQRIMEKTPREGQ